MCREEWKEFARKDGESPLQHEARVKQTFTFRREPPADSPHFIDEAPKVGSCCALPAASLVCILFAFMQCRMSFHASLVQGSLQLCERAHELILGS